MRSLQFVLLLMLWPTVLLRWETAIRENAHRIGVDPALIAAIIWTESGGDPNSIGLMGEIGLMQIMPFPWRPATNILADPEYNLWYGSNILKEALNIANGNPVTALAYYNCGQAGVVAGTCGQHGGYAYAQRVLNTCRVFGGCLPRQHGYEPR